MGHSIFDRYPQLKTLRGLVPDEIVEHEIGSRVDVFEADLERAKKNIPTINLNKIFPLELERGLIQLENFLGHWGNVSIEEVAKIALITKFFQPKKAFEFGTYNGMTTLQIALNTSDDCEIYTLDLPPDDAGSTRFQMSLLDRYVVERFYGKFPRQVGGYFKGHSVAKKITQIYSDSASYDYSSFYKMIDFIFIDAAHDYQNKKSDTENSFRMLAPKGIILWDNYADIVNPDVTKYLADISKTIPLYHLRNTPLVVYWNNI